MHLNIQEDNMDVKIRLIIENAFRKENVFCEDAAKLAEGVNTT